MKKKKTTRRITGGVSHTPIMKQQLARPDPSRVLFVRAHLWSFFFILVLKNDAFFCTEIVWEISFFFSRKVNCPLQNRRIRKICLRKKKSGSRRPPRMRIERVQKKRGGDGRYRSPYPSNANRMLYHLSYLHH